MALLLPLTELEAVNLILESIGEQPVSTLIDPDNSYVAIASSTLTNTSRNLQMKGWTFNNETNYPLALDIHGFLNVPTNALKIKAVGSSLDITQRGGKLYDKTNHTFVFTVAVKVDITLFLDYEDLPQAARTLIYVLASRDFQKKVLGSDTLTSITKEDEQAAQIAFAEEEADNGDYNIFDSYDTARPLLRNQNPYSRGGR